MVADRSSVSIVIPCYRGERTIMRAIDSALAQCDGQVRIVVVIDDQHDPTEGMLVEMSDARITVLVNEANVGAPTSRNKGLALVTTPFVAFLDADDFYEGDLLAPVIAAMKKRSADVGFGPSLRWNQKDGYGHYFVPDYRDHNDVFLRWLSGMHSVNTASVVWRTDYLRKIGGWDEAIKRNQDGELSLRAMLLGAKFAMSDRGAGVWVNDPAAARITTQTSNLQSLLDVERKLGGMKSKFISDDVSLTARASYLHMVAHLAYRAGADAVGADAMTRRRKLGFGAGRGRLRHRLSVASRFIPRPLRLRLWPPLLALKRRYDYGRSRPDNSSATSFSGR